jgi:hypothetical protein
MKNLRTFLLCVCMIAYSVCSFGQSGDVPLNEPNPNKPRLFTGLPELINVDVAVFGGLLNAEVGTSVNIPVSAAFRIQGHVVSAVSKYGNSIRSVVVRSINYTGASLTISRITDEDGVIIYTGRIMSMAHGDLYELQNQNGQYSFVKKNFYTLLNE